MSTGKLMHILVMIFSDNKTLAGEKLLKAM